MVAVPVAPTDVVPELVDEVVCLATPRNFGSVGAHYVEFGPVSNDEVVECLKGVEEGG